MRPDAQRADKMTTTIAAISKALEIAMKVLQGDLREELRDQGHYSTGRLHESIQYEIKSGSDTVTALVECEDYGLALEFGVPAGKIPFSPGSGAGSSQYIQGLITDFQQKGLQGREAISAAFATANVQKRTGMPTPGSYRFSNNGDRLGFASKTLERDLDIIGRILEKQTGAFLEVNISSRVEKSTQVEVFTLYT